MEIKILQKVCTSIQKGLPKSSIMVISGDQINAVQDTKLRKPKSCVILYCSVPQSVCDSYHVAASDWIQPIMEILGGKGNGKNCTAQGQGIDFGRIDEAIAASRLIFNKLRR
jgi:alanyl-tRNA synthetase